MRTKRCFLVAYTGSALQKGSHCRVDVTGNLVIKTDGKFPSCSSIEVEMRKNNNDVFELDAVVQNIFEFKTESDCLDYIGT